MPMLIPLAFTGWLLTFANPHSTVQVPPATVAHADFMRQAALPPNAQAQQGGAVKQPRELPPRPVGDDRLFYRAHYDVPITFAATAVWIIAEVEKTRLVSVNCKWCDRSPDGTDTLNGFDAWGQRALKWHDTGRAIAFSNVTGFVLSPAAAYGLDWIAARHDGRQENGPVDAILISQSMAIASDVTEVLKFAVGRERPFVHALAPGAPAVSPPSAENNTSFPSGHATLAFAVVTSGGEIANLRGYRYAPWIWRLGLPLATLTAYFRVAADRHYLTDVMMGAGVGSAIGIGVPYLAHRRKTDHRIPIVRVMPTRGGEAVAAQWVW